MKKLILISLLGMIACGETKDSTGSDIADVKLITLDPGHFHAALVQKTMYPGVDLVVHVYAPAGNDLTMHLDRINNYNQRPESPTRWKEEIYTGNDFFQKMIAEKKGNVVVLSGNNQKKTAYILESLRNGLHVLADKPMVIDSTGFNQLKQAFEVARQNNLLLYDVMTERFEITNILQRELSMIEPIFGKLEKGSADNPAIVKESVHHFYKFVSGNVLTRPAWFLDVKQQGEGIVDVMTHLVDLVQWACFPEQTLDYARDISIQNARRWVTEMSQEEFNAITKLDSFPSYLAGSLRADNKLSIYCNGEINYSLKGIHARTSVTWNYKAPEGTGDTHFSIMRGSRCNLAIRQGAAENFKPELYIETVGNDPNYPAQVVAAFKKLQEKYAGIELQKTSAGWKVVIPEKYKEGHEAHFGRVMENFLSYLEKKQLPDWEVPNMLAKYYTTVNGLAWALKHQ